MQQKVIEHIINLAKGSINHPLFYPRIFALTTKYQREVKHKESNPVQSILLDEFEELSRRLDRSEIQESCAVRNVLKTRKLAQLLIDDKGEINVPALNQAIGLLKKNLYSLGPQRQHDSRRQEHILNVLQLLSTRKDLVFLLKKFTRPIMNKLAEDLIRDTLQLPPNTVVTDVLTKQAVLSSWLCYLRQNVGSCFATAPAVIIHDEQPENFLQDLLDLIATATLKRTFSGIENSVPLSESWGSGDLKKPIALRISSQGITPEIWFSPGLMTAFEMIGLLKPQNNQRQKINQIELWIKAIIKTKQTQPYCFITAEEILSKVIMNSIGITEKQLKEYENRPKNMVHSQLVILSPASASTKGSGINEKCAQYLTLFETAKTAFKSIADNALLKAWEFTLASFSDVKYEFARWNFYASLGLQTDEPGGIGQYIYRTIQQRLEAANRKTQDIQYEYEMVYTQVKTLESRMRHASTEKELEWLKIEYQSRKNEFYFIEEQRNEAQSHANALVNLYDTLYHLYVELFKNYFQEVYDADMQEITKGPFDDSPAGFRLLYKHGRSNPSQWTRIKNHDEFIESLAAFFVATEPQIAHELEGKKIERDLADVVTGIINHVRSTEFIESAFHRMAMAHKAPLIKNPLEHLDKIEKKPWVYTSGGTMNTLVSCYYRFEEKPKEVEKWMESEMELLVFLAEAVKQIPPQIFDPFLKGRRKSMLIHSPTHAFLFKPTISPFKEAWMHEEFTYTYIRDKFLRPSEIFIEKLLLSDEMIRYLLQKLIEKIPENFRPRFKSVFNSLQGPLSPFFFRDALVEMLEIDRGLQAGHYSILPAEEIDSLLYSSLPLFSVDELRHRIQNIISLLPGYSADRVNRVLQIFDLTNLSRGESSVISAQQLQDICKALLCLSEDHTITPYDYHFHITAAAQKLEYAMPSPLIFADTNWIKDMFGFVVNPGTAKLELWRLDINGSAGYPMTSWKQWVDGSRSDIRWGIHTKPYEYGQV